MSYIGNTLGPAGENYGRSGAVQPISAFPSQTAASDGTISFTFPHVALGQVWTGTINVGSAPDSANFTAVTGASTFGQFKGSNSWGPIQLGGGDQLVVTGTGLTPGINYQCSFQGAAVTGADPGIIYPSAYADTVTTSSENILIGSRNIKPPASTTTTYTVTVPIFSTYRGIYFYIVYGPGTVSTTITFNIVSVLGNLTGYSYYPATALGNGGNINFAVVNGIDTSVTITYTATTGSTPGTFKTWWGADLGTIYVNANITNSYVEALVFNDPVHPVYIEGITGGTSVAVDTAAGNGLEVYEVGGLLGAGVTLTSTTTTNLLAAPAAGNAYRIHSISIFGNTASQSVRFGTNSQPFATLIIGQAPQAMTMNGLTTTTALSVTSSAATSIFAYVTYDLITTPTIS